MEKLTDTRQLSGFGWTQMVEQPWPRLVEAGLPPQLCSLAYELGRYRSRPIRSYTMPMLEAGVAGLALPFVADDGIVIDPLLLSDGQWLGEVVAHELAYMLDPNWDDPAKDLESFASKVAPMLLAKPPLYQWTDDSLLATPGGATAVAVDDARPLRSA